MQGRRVNEIESAIKRIDCRMSYTSITQRIMRKLEANNMPHALCKAIALNIISTSDILNIIN